MDQSIGKLTGLLAEPLPGGWWGVRVWISIFHFLACVLLASCASPAIAAIEWMMAFHPANYPGPGGILRFLSELQTGIPPIQAILELISYDLTGSLTPVTVWLYRAGLVGVHVLSLHWVKRSNFHFVLCSVVSLVFLWATVLIHRQMPVSYDVFFPLLVLVFLFLAPSLDVQANRNASWSFLRVAAAGICLSVLELTRPFIILLLPVLLLGPLLALRATKDWKKLFVFLLPLAALSGGWHTKMLVCHGQWVWTNQSGFNLLRAWEKIGVETPPFVDASGNPASPNEPGLINSDHHTALNREVQQAVVRAILEKPGQALRLGLYRLKVFLTPRTSIYHLTPVDGFGILVYRACVWISIANLIFQTLRLIFKVCGLKSLHLLALKQNQLVLFTLFFLLILALGEAGEEARLMISLLPLLGSIPLFQNFKERITVSDRQ